MDSAPIERAPVISRLERLFKTDLHYLVKGGFWLAVGQFVASASVFILAVAFANLVPKETYGIYKYVQSVAGLLAIFGMSGMNTYIAQAVARGAEATFLSGLRSRIRWGFLGGLASVLVAFYYVWVGNTLLAEAFAIVAIGMPFADALGLYNVYLQSKKQFRESIIYFSIVQILSVAFLFVTVFFTQNVLVLVVVYFFPPIAMRYYFHRRTVKRHPPNSVNDPQALRYGAHLSIVNVIAQVTNYIDAIIVFHLLGAAPVAVYAFALAPTEQIRSLFTKNLPPLALPQLAKRSVADIDRSLARRLLVLTLAGVVIAIGYAVIAPYVFGLFFPKYLDAVELSRLFAVLIAITMPSALVATALQSKLHTFPPSWLYGSVVADALHLIVIVSLVPFWGIYGIVVAKLVESASAYLISVMQWRWLAARPI